MQTRSGDVHLVYTWKRKAIKHVAFNVAWLDERLGTHRAMNQTALTELFAAACPWLVLVLCLQQVASWCGLTLRGWRLLSCPARLRSLAAAPAGRGLDDRALGGRASARISASR